MSSNLSSFSNDSFSLSPINATPFHLYCLVFEPHSWVFFTFTITNVLLLLPLCILVFYHGLQRCLQQSSSPILPTATHSDNFTYHLAVMELINVFGTVICCCGIYRTDVNMLKVWYCLFSVSWYGETLFHILTCVEHYLAVVYPITFLSLRNERWITIRNTGIGCIWLLCFGLTCLVALGISTYVVDVFLLIASVVIISFCNLSVLCTLLRPGPLEQGKNRERIDQSKQRALYTIKAILGVLMLRCAWNLVWSVHSVLHGMLNKCVWTVTDVWINLPSSLVLPLLFLQRTGTIACCRQIKD